MSTLTNKYGAPLPLWAANNYDTYDPGPCDTTTTRNIDSVRRVALMERHKDKIVEDVADRIHSMWGQIGHGVLERARLALADQETHIRETRLSWEFKGWVLSGGTDLFLLEDPYKGNVVLDYKFTSVYSFLLGDKAEWEAQLNTYAHLWRLHGYRVDGLEICGMFRDWQKSKAKREPDYPDVPWAIKHPRLWSHDEAQAYIEERVLLHQLAESQPDAELPYCSHEERWGKKTTFAVKKRANKTASGGRVFDSKDDATAYVAQRNLSSTVWEIETRPGDPMVRCRDYCVVRDFCNQYKEMRDAR